MFDIVKINRNDKKSLRKIEKIYETSFHINERRNFKDVLVLIDNTSFNFNAIIFEEEIIGLFFYWTFPEFIYIEHFAIDESYRGNKIGSYILNKFLMIHEKQIILEVDLPSDDISLKRIKFYERYGFVICKEDYIQPPYNAIKEAVPMIIMSKPEIINIYDFENIKNKLYTEIYNN